MEQEVITVNGSGVSRREFLRRAGLAAGAVASAQALAALSAAEAHAATGETRQTYAGTSSRPNVVLVHGAWADGSSWSAVIRLLQEAGYPVRAAAIPLTSLSDDVARTRALLAQVEGPTILVGHSIGGAVITGAGAGADAQNVRALVYVSAFAPDEGESIAQLAFDPRFPPEPGLSHLTPPDDLGFVYVEPDAFPRYFAQDLPRAQARVLATVQRPLHKDYIFGQAGPAAWRSLPSWFLISRDDLMIDPDLQRFYAGRMDSKTREVRASHASLISRSEDVVAMIAEATRATAGG